MKEIQLKDVKVGQGFYEKETGFYYNRVELKSNYKLDDPVFLPVLSGRWEVVPMDMSTIVLIDDY